MPYHLPEVPEPHSFDYTALNAETRTFVQAKTTEIKRLIRRSAQDIIDIGQKLIEVKEQLGHGNFRRWLRTEFTWSIPAANKFMQVAQKFKSINFIHLDIAASALYLLAAPSTPKEARHEAIDRANKGEVITYALAKQIRSHHTIDVEAEVVEDAEEPSNPTKSLSALTPQSQLELDEPSSAPELTEANSSSIEFDRDRKGLPEPETITTFSNYGMGDLIRILRHQHGEDNWSGKSAKIWQITPDGWLQVDVEGHKGVRFNLRPDWVEPMIEQTNEPLSQQPEPVIPQSWADEPGPESPAVADVSFVPQKEAPPRFQTGDRLYIYHLNQQDNGWVAEVAEVVEAADKCVRVIVEIPRQSS